MFHPQSDWFFISLPHQAKVQLRLQLTIIKLKFINTIFHKQFVFGHLYTTINVPSFPKSS